MFVLSDPGGMWYTYHFPDIYEYQQSNRFSRCSDVSYDVCREIGEGIILLKTPSRFYLYNLRNINALLL